MATLVGCNYFNSPNELHGCINDVQAMRDLLVTRYDFDPANIELLTGDAPEDSPSKPTGNYQGRAWPDGGPGQVWRRVILSLQWAWDQASGWPTWPPSFPDGRGHRPL